MNSLDRFTITESKFGDVKRKFRSVYQSKIPKEPQGLNPNSKLNVSNKNIVKSLGANLFEIFDGNTSKQQEEIDEFQNQLYSRIEVKFQTQDISSLIYLTYLGK